MHSQDQSSQEARSSQDCNDGENKKPKEFVNGEGSKEFLSTGRTGRRNALPDILGEHASTTTAGLPEKFESLDAGGMGNDDTNYK